MLEKWRGYVSQTWGPLRDVKDLEALETYEGTLSGGPPWETAPEGKGGNVRGWASV